MFTDYFFLFFLCLSFERNPDRPSPIDDHWFFSPASPLRSPLPLALFTFFAFPVDFPRHTLFGFPGSRFFLFLDPSATRGIFKEVCSAARAVSARSV